jgi:hypothetical protein
MSASANNGWKNRWKNGRARIESGAAAPALGR